jgi:hypothetical protein
MGSATPVGTAGRSAGFEQPGPAHGAGHVGHDLFLGLAAGGYEDRPARFRNPTKNRSRHRIDGERGVEQASQLVVCGHFRFCPMGAVRAEASRRRD